MRGYLSYEGDPDAVTIENSDLDRVRRRLTGEGFRYTTPADEAAYGVTGLIRVRGDGRFAALDIHDH